MLSQSAIPRILPEPFQRDAVQPMLDRMQAAKVMPRLWNKDASLWSDQPTEQAKIRQRLGWLSIALRMRAEAGQLTAFAEEMRRAGFQRALLLGMGGSSLFAEVCRHLFGVTPGWLDVTVLDTTDPAAITAAANTDLSRTLFLVSSKSGSTIESSALCDYFYDRLRQTSSSPGQQFIAITDAGTSLQTLAKERGFRRTFTLSPDTGQDIGGRFSALSYFGMVPAALLGADIARLLDRAIQMQRASGPELPIDENLGAQLGAFFAATVAQGRDKLTLLASPRTARFGVWIEQLIAESTGKHGQGLIPIVGEPPRPASAYGPDRLFVDVRMANEPDDAARADALAKASHPIIRVVWEDACDLGAEVMRWCLATAIVAWAMRVNPFDEPNVQESKDRTKALLEAPKDRGLSLFANPQFFPGPTVADALRQLQRSVKPGDYLVIVSFLPRSPAIDARLNTLREHLGRSLGMPTMSSIGPRYLHSTGQLHKGGPDRAILLFFTADDAEELPVPGKPYTFGELKQAQAMGDFQALQERNRRVLRIHLTEPGERGLAALEQAVDQTLPLPPPGQPA